MAGLFASHIATPTSLKMFFPLWVTRCIRCAHNAMTKRLSRTNRVGFLELRAETLGYVLQSPAIRGRRRNGR